MNETYLRESDLKHLDGNPLVVEEHFLLLIILHLFIILRLINFD